MGCSGATGLGWDIDAADSQSWEKKHEFRALEKNSFCRATRNYMQLGNRMCWLVTGTWRRRDLLVSGRVPFKIHFWSFTALQALVQNFGAGKKGPYHGIHFPLEATKKMLEEMKASSRVLLKRIRGNLSLVFSDPDSSKYWKSTKIPVN